MLHHLLVCVVVSTLLCEHNFLMISEQYFLYYILDLLDIYELVLCNFITQKYLLMATVII